MSINEKNIIENEKKKYVDFIKKNYNQKITEELQSINKLKKKIKEFQNQASLDKDRDDENLIQQ